MATVHVLVTPVLRPAQAELESGRKPQFQEKKLGAGIGTEGKDGKSGKEDATGFLWDRVPPFLNS